MLCEIQDELDDEFYYSTLKVLYSNLRLLILNKTKNSSFKRAYAYLVGKRMIEQILINDMEVDAEVKQVIDLLNLILKCPGFNTNINYL